jgi:hypothetical protein
MWTFLSKEKIDMDRFFIYFIYLFIFEFSATTFVGYK